MSNGAYTQLHFAPRRKDSNFETDLKNVDHQPLLSTFCARAHNVSKHPSGPSGKGQ